jgi:hypothetical protein
LTGEKSVGLVLTVIPGNSNRQGKVAQIGGLPNYVLAGQIV